MKKTIFQILKGLYLATLCASLPLAFIHLAPLLKTGGTASVILLIASYAYIGFWLLLFVYIPFLEFPKTIRAALPMVLAPFVNAAGFFFINRTESTYLDFIGTSSATYFSATTIALGAMTTVMILRTRLLNTKVATKKAVLFLWTVACGYAGILNYHSFTTLQHDPSNFWKNAFLIAMSAVLASSSLLSKMDNSSPENEIKSQESEKLSIDHWQTISVISLVLSGAASMIILLMW